MYVGISKNSQTGFGIHLLSLCSGHRISGTAGIEFLESCIDGLRLFVNLRDIWK
jgi:hypothetical protein